VMSRCVVRFTDRTLAYQDNTDKADDPRAFFVLQEHRTANVDRPYITRADQAIAHGAETLRTVGRPVMEGDIAVRREFGRTIRAGDYVLLDIDIEPNVTTLYAFFRVTKRTIPATGPIKLSLIGDNTLSLVPWTNAHPPNVPVQTNVPQIATCRIMESPYGLSNSAWKVICLALRPTGLITGFHVAWDTSDDEGSYVTLGGQTTFAANATLSADVGVTDTTINVTVPAQLDGDLFTMQPGAHQANNDELLLFIVNLITGGGPSSIADDENGYAEVECCSVSASTLVSPGHYQLTVLRGRLGTVAQAFSAVAGQVEVWLVPRSSLVEYSHAEFPAMVQGFSVDTAVQTTSYFRLTPYTYIAELLLSDASAIPFTFPVKSYAAPQLELTSPSSSPLTVTAPTYPYSFSVAGTWLSSNDNLVSWRATLQKSTDTSPRILGSSVFARTDSAAFNLTAVLESGGSYVLTLLGTDSNGLSTTAVINITATGSGAKAAVPAWAFKGVAMSQSTSEATAAANPNYGSIGPLTAVCATPGSSVFFSARYYYAYYSIPTGDGYEAGSWTFGWSAWSAYQNVSTVTPFHAQALIPVANGSIKIALQQEFRAYASASGMTDSDVIYINIVDFTSAPLYFPGW
ncbi:MAG TPA: hypothetical protein VFB72_15955, partial [Verrucomicrobiae bacterium]|nr:hypothetical protein [Verrucomicrobiae bacterium]